MSKFIADPADDVAIATIRTLAVDVVGKANSGHPGMHRALFLVRVIFISFSQVHPWAWPQSHTSFSLGNCQEDYTVKM